ncbi:MAG: hypothetical protein GWN86_18635, partial [Desulfobacterales bacterium]|nr:hypothetical protein [Desulfobacterales bacterium]
LQLGGYQKFQLHNVDVPAGQLYLYQNDLFPLAYLEVKKDGENLRFHLLDSVASTDYQVPPLRKMWIDVETEKSGKLSSFNDPIGRLEVSIDDKKKVIQEGSEDQKLLNLIGTVKEEDP